MAIALDAATDGGLVNPGTSLTFSHTTSGSNRILFVAAFGPSTDILTGATYNGVSMTLIDKTAVGGDLYIYLWYLIAPATGANNVVISASGSAQIQGGAISYTGAKQTGQPDASNKSNTDTTGTPTISVTTVADNSWAVLALRPSVGGTPTAGAGSTMRVAPTDGFAMADSNAAITPAGSYSMTINVTGSAGNAMVIASFAPDTGGGGSRPVRMAGPWGGYAGESGGFVG